MNPSDDGDGQWHAGGIFERHRNAHEQEERNAFDLSDGSKGI